MSRFHFPTRGASLAVLGFACALAACEPDGDTDVAPDLDVVVVDEGEDGVTSVLADGNADEVVDDLDALAIDLSDFEYTTERRPDGTVDEVVTVEGDIELDVDEFERLTAPGATQGRHYRTNRLVSQNRTIKVVGWTGGRGYGLNSTQRTALQWAVNNYNALNIGLTFTLQYGSSGTGADMVIYRNPEDRRTGGKAGWPKAGGAPHKWIQLWTGMDRENTNTNEHVITHEMGHAVGLRHTDFATRQSCGQNSREQTGPGLNFIPGTPSGYDRNSVMLACFGNEDGEFGFYDKVALEYLY